MEYSVNGETKKEAAMQGATGKVEQHLLAGKAQLKQIKIDEMEIDELNISVLNSFPGKLKKAGIAGIIGTDILMRSGTLSFLSLNKGKGTIQFGSGIENAETGIEIPFTMAGGLLFTDGTIGSTPIRFLFDTGARETILSKSFAEEHHLVYPVVNNNKTITGIDDKPLPVNVVKVPSFTIHGYSFGNTNMILADIAALSAFGLNRSSAILGMDFFRQYNSMELDFNKRRIILQ
ncbi:MAG: clan AA aspartic protease [Chitinophagaceae bacterium]|nr:clan AA aspartic protease [Chitinophagaceae bacterium]